MVGQPGTRGPIGERGNRGYPGSQGIVKLQCNIVAINF